MVWTPADNLKPDFNCIGMGSLDSMISLIEVPSWILASTCWPAFLNIGRNSLNIDFKSSLASKWIFVPMATVSSLIFWTLGLKYNSSYPIPSKNFEMVSIEELSFSKLAWAVPGWTLNLASAYNEVSPCFLQPSTNRLCSAFLFTASK